MGYPQSKLAFHYKETGGHAVPCRRAVFSEFLTAMVYQRVEPLQK